MSLSLCFALCLLQSVSQYPILPLSLTASSLSPSFSLSTYLPSMFSSLFFHSFLLSFLFLQLPSVPPPPIFPLLLHSFSFSSFCLLSSSSLFLLFPSSLPSFLFPTFRFLGMVCTKWLQSGNMTRGRSMVQTLFITVCV